MSESESNKVLNVSMSVSFENGKIVISHGEENGKAKQARHKGNSLLKTTSSYCVIDLETTGLDPAFDEIIEMAAIKVSNGVVIDTFSRLVKPENPLSDFIEELTGITNEMLKNQEPIKNVLPDFLRFVGDNLIVGHNVNFDINFIYDNSMKILSKPFQSDYLDTMRLARRVLPELPHHRLKDLVKEYHIEHDNAHRALSDCAATLEVLKRLDQDAQDRNIDLAQQKARTYWKASDLTTNNTEFDESSPVFGKTFVFTGTLAKMTRKEAMQIVVNLGGKCADNVTAKTNYLVLGCFDYSVGIKGEKSSKLLKAENMILKDKDITILSENAFYDFIGDNS